MLSAHRCTARASPKVTTSTSFATSATSLALGVTLLADRLDPDAQVDDQVVDLPAGATAVFHVTSRGLDQAALVARPVLRTENDLVAHPAS